MISDLRFMVLHNKSEIRKSETKSHISDLFRIRANKSIPTHGAETKIKNKE